MQIPDLPDGPEEIKESDNIDKDTPFIENLYFNKQHLTKIEALNLLNHLTMVLLIHESNR